MKKWDVLVRVAGWASVGIVEAPTKEEAQKKAEALEHDRSLSFGVNDVYDVLECDDWTPDVEEQ